jgi:amino acid adenylation domain-containing protein
MSAPVGAGASASKRALLEMRLRRAAVTAKPQPSHAQATENSPLSSSQERIWLTQQLEPHSPICNRPAHLRLRGSLEIVALRRALEEIVRRHQVLRSTFSEANGRVTQSVMPPAAIELLLIDLSHLPPVEAEIDARRRADQQSQQIFDLKSGPIFRAELLRLSAGDHVLLLTIHHIAFDAWSMSVLKRELAGLYRAFAGGYESRLPRLPIQYGQFADWQREEIGGERLRGQIDYFKKKLSGLLPILNLPVDLQRAAAGTFPSGRVAITLDATLSQAMKDLCAAEGVTLFMLILAAFKALLSRYTGANDIVVGCPVAGRSRADAEQLIGCFINMLPLRTDLSGDPSFRELLRRVKETSLGAYANQDVPIERLIQELRPPRDLSRIPLFNVLFNYRNVPKVDVPEGGIRIEDFACPQPGALLDLSLELADSPAGLECAFEYDADVFDTATVEGMLHRLELLLRGVIADASMAITQIPLITAHERAQLLVKALGTRQEFPRDLCFHELFARTAARRPHANAIRSTSRTMTYRELDRESGKLATVLRSMGVGQDVPVGLCVERSCELIVAILGILKAGGAYVPLDPDYPKNRIELIAADCGFKVLVTQRKLAGRLANPQIGILCIDEIDKHSADKPTEGVPGVPATSLSYIIYTSGSTGTPKGVAIEHRSLVNYVTTAYAPLGLRENDSVLQFASIAFDASVEDIFCPLACGATVVLRTDDMLGSAAGFLDECGRQGITVAILPTAYFHEVAGDLAAGRAKLPPGLRMVVIGGEALLPQRLAEWHEAVGSSVKLINLYGPTETTVSATMWDCSQWLGRDGPLPLRCPIGRAMPNYQVYLLDTHLQPVPDGMTGEIFIAGEGLAHGYLNQPELTRERFIPNPFADSGERLYRTGDLARRLVDGNLEFVGRADQQVKVRGFRIELGEIESAICAHPQISEAAVVAWAEGGDQRLAAYIVPQVAESVSERELREFLSVRLPSYMVPAAIVISQRLPTASSGKIDRRSLPRPEWSDPAAAEGEPIYRNTTEETLASIWSEVLGVSRIGVDDNFFDLGGHSLLAVRLLGLVNSTFKVNLPPASLFTNPTIAHLAIELQSSARDSANHPLTCLNAGSDLPPFFYLHGDFAGQGLYCANIARHLDPRQPFYVLHTLGADGRPAFERIEQMAAYYLRQIRRVRAHGPYVLGGFCNGGAIAFEIARRLREQGEHVPLVILIASALDQMRIRPFFRLVNRFGDFIGMPFDSQVAFALWVQGKRRRWRQVSRHGTGARVRLAIRKAGTLARRVRAWMRTELHSDPQSQTAGDADYVRLSEHYHLSMAGYDPKPYTGRVMVLWPDEESARYRRDPTLGWRRLAPQMKVELVPGHHTTCLTLHGRQLARRISQALAESS